MGNGIGEVPILSDFLFKKETDASGLSLAPDALGIDS